MTVRKTIVIPGLRGGLANVIVPEHTHCHSDLDCLDHDDHPQYYNTARLNAFLSQQGYITDLSNLGTGIGLFTGKSGSIAQLRSIKSGNNINISLDDNGNSLKIEGNVPNPNAINQIPFSFNGSSWIPALLQAGANVSINYDSANNRVIISATGGGGGGGGGGGTSLLDLYYYDALVNGVLDITTNPPQYATLKQAIDSGKTRILAVGSISIGGAIELTPPSQTQNRTIYINLLGDLNAVGDINSYDTFTYSRDDVATNIIIDGNGISNLNIQYTDASNSLVLFNKVNSTVANQFPNNLIRLRNLTINIVVPSNFSDIDAYYLNDYDVTFDAQNNPYSNGQILFLDNTIINLANNSNNSINFGIKALILVTNNCFINYISSTAFPGKLVKALDGLQIDLRIDGLTGGSNTNIEIFYVVGDVEILASQANILYGFIDGIVDIYAESVKPGASL